MKKSKPNWAMNTYFIFWVEHGIGTAFSYIPGHFYDDVLTPNFGHVLVKKAKMAQFKRDNPILSHFANPCHRGHV